MQLMLIYSAFFIELQTISEIQLKIGIMSMMVVINLHYSSHPGIIRFLFYEMLIVCVISVVLSSGFSLNILSQKVYLEVISPV